MSHLRLTAEEACADELEGLAALPGARPPGWQLTPRAVRTFLVGGELADGTVIAPKYIGDPRRIEVAIATLATDRALLLQGEPGTGKSWVSEHLAAAISGDSTLLVQGTAGTDESSLTYGWNYARLLAEGPSAAAVVHSPLLVAMRTGGIARIEELTRLPSEVQDALLGLLSEKSVPIPELGSAVRAEAGFNLIATSNLRDRGVNELSSALRRRFAVVELPAPDNAADELHIVLTRLASLAGVPVDALPAEPARALVGLFRELRAGHTTQGRPVRRPSGGLSTADAIGVLHQGWTRAQFYGDGALGPAQLADGLVACAARTEDDRHALREYAELVLAERGEAAWSGALRDRL